MHRSWYVDDIRLLIFEHLESGDLARLARANKTIFDWATDHLWATLHSLRPFAGCLQASLQNKNRRIRREEVDRLDLYARKVRTLITDDNKAILAKPLDSKHKNNDRARSWEDLWTDIAELRPNTLFLPNLVRLHACDVAESNLLPLVGITGSCITSIHIGYLSQLQVESVVRKFLDGLQNTSKLEHLFVRDGEPDLVPSKLLKHSSLNALYLDPQLHRSSHQEHQFKQFPLRLEIIQNSTLEHLALGLTRQWHSSDVRDLSHRYLPALKELWLYLTTFRASTCHSSCTNATTDSWTCVNASRDDQSITHTTPKDCGRRPPSLFLRGLDNPQLDILKIIFAYDVSGEKVLEVVEAASRGCRLEKLSELALLNGGYDDTDDPWGVRPPPKITPQHMWTAVLPLLPLPNLKTLRLTIVPDFLKELRLPLYQSMADGLPNLQTLALGHSDFATRSLPLAGPRVVGLYERVPLRNLAAFCHMVPGLVSVEVGCLDNTTSEEETPCVDWSSPNVRRLSIGRWVCTLENGRRNNMDVDGILKCLYTYFPAVPHRYEQNGSNWMVW